jgi:hypothetical protein
LLDSFLFFRLRSLRDWKIIYLGRLAVKDRDKTPRITGVILITGSMAEVGAEEVAPTLGGGIDALVTGVKEAGMEVKEAAEGVIIDTMPAAYFFAFSKKPSSSKRGQRQEELTFS